MEKDNQEAKLGFHLEVKLFFFTSHLSLLFNSFCYSFVRSFGLSIPVNDQYIISWEFLGNLNAFYLFGTPLDPPRFQTWRTITLVTFPRQLVLSGSRIYIVLPCRFRFSPHSHSLLFPSSLSVSLIRIKAWQIPFKLPEILLTYIERPSTCSTYTISSYQRSSCDNIVGTTNEQQAGRQQQRAIFISYNVVLNLSVLFFACPSQAQVAESGGWKCPPWVSLCLVLTYNFVVRTDA